MARWRHWREAFEQRIGPNVRQYWALYRNFADGLPSAQGQEWRDKTVIPESFKIIETRLPRKILGLWGTPESWGVEGRGYNDEKYEHMVKELIQEALDEIGTGDPRNELFHHILIDGERYRQIMGHVFWKVYWRKQWDWVSTKAQDALGKWQPILMKELIYDNVDIRWMGLDSIALDLTGSRRWIIEKLITSWEKLYSENEKYKDENGTDLYQNLDLIEAGRYQTSPVQRDSYEEPRVTERWPLSDGRILSNPGEHQVELWLCWDNQSRTLTKIANRSVELDHGLAPTPRGFDPYLSLPAIPIPGRVYGDSILNWTGPLSRYQTRIARARADEVLLNIWQQFFYREGSLRGTQLFWRPGGGAPIEAQNDERPISDHVMIFPRRPVFQEAWQEEGYRQQQAEATAAADPVSQGNEATQKSRDVSATEIQQRVLQGASRYELERLYDEVAFKKPLLGMIFDLLRQNLTTPKQIRVLADNEEAEENPGVTLKDLDRPVDIVITGSALDISKAEKLQEIQSIINIAGNPIFMPILAPRAREILIEMLRNTRTLSRNTKRFVPPAGTQPMLPPPAAGGGTGPVAAPGPVSPAGMQRGPVAPMAAPAPEGGAPPTPAPSGGGGGPEDITV